MRRVIVGILWGSVYLQACGEKTETVDILDIDDDNDGFTENDGDCNDFDANIHPNASEVCDYLDNDCDGLTDDDDDSLDSTTGSEFYTDSDVDGFGDNGVEAVWACVQPENTSDNNTDCDDTSADVSPNATEVCDEIDNDCDGLTDDDDDSVDTTGGDTFYLDIDGDGEGAGDGVAMCALAEGYSANNTDCDDSDTDNNNDGIPDGAVRNNSDTDNDGLTSCGEDSDADGRIDTRDCDDNDALVGATDADGDGFIACINDCNDNDASLQQSDTDGDGISSCAGDCDDNDASVGVIDLDGDGFSGCIDDCLDMADDNDGDGIPDSAAVFPGAAQLEPSLCTADIDGDGYGDANIRDNYPSSTCFLLALVDSGSYWDNAAVEAFSYGVSIGSYTNTSASPSNTEETFEVCGNGPVTLNYTCTSTYDCTAHTIRVYVDDNNDGTYNSLIYASGALEGGGSPTSGDFTTIQLSSADAGSDCDDGDAQSIGDGDGDGFTFCTTDCDDGDATINTQATEVYYDGVDQNCDGFSDFDQDGDGVDIYAYDCDGDGTPDTACDFTGDGLADWRGGEDCDDGDANSVGDDDYDGYYSCIDDCDDSDYDINPSIAETHYDGVDNNCDSTDEFDQDGDGDNIASFDCDGDGTPDTNCDFDGDGVDDYVAGTDCDDLSYNRNGFDADQDGFSTCPDSNNLFDCNDGDANTYPGVATNEASYVAGDYSTHYCATDSDGDGYASSPSYSCYTIDMTDDYGDGWNGNAIAIYEDGVWITSISNQNTINGLYFPETESTQYCPTGTVVDFRFVQGNFTEEVSFSISYDDGGNGVLLHSGYGYSNGTLNVSDVIYSNGESFFMEYWGSDANDMDANSH